MASFVVLELSGSPEELEIATAALHERGCLGTEELDNGAGLRAYFSESADIDALAHELGARIAEPLLERDWLAEWKAGLEGFELGSRYYVLPTWKPDAETDRTVLRIDPEQAFGTGTHETTQLCVELVEDYVEEGMSVIDVGAGTGILSMIAAHEGASSVLAIDIEPPAVECARANVQRNGLSDKIRIECGSWEDFAPFRADVVVANINVNVLRGAARKMHGTVILAGILTDDVAALRDELPGKFIEERSANEWSALVMRRE